jgi:hypothetical protein
VTPETLPGSLTLRRMPVLGLTIAIVVGTGLGLRGVLRSVADLYPDALPPQPFFVPAHALLLYLAMPLALLGAVGMLLAPGFLLALVAGGSRRFGMLAAASFGGALLLRALSHAALKLSGVVPLEVGTFTLTEVALDAALLGLLALRLQSGRPVALPAEPEDRRRLGWMVAIVVLTAVLLLPALFWQDLTDDGLEALEIGRSLATHIVPRFPTSPSGLLGLGIGMLTMAYPNGWFVSLIGPVEAAARLPLALYLPLLFAVITGLIECRSPRRLGVMAEGSIVLVLAAFVVTMVFSASYTTYSADASAPAAFETLTVLCIAATILFAWEGRTGWMLGFALLAYFARPTGLLVLGLLALGTVALSPAERRGQLIRLGGAIALCLGAAVLYEKVFLPRAAHGLGVAYASGSILNRVRYLTFTDVRRVLYLVVPGGILPALALLTWRRQDPLARQLTLFCVLYFLFFYPQAFIALHHFVPVMILPVVVYWRVALAGNARWPGGAAALAAALSLVISLPRSFPLDRSIRALGKATDVRVGNLNGDWPAYRQALHGRIGLSSLFHPEWEVANPARERVGAPLGMLYYASRGRTAADTVNYVIQLEGAAPPAGFTAVAMKGGLAVFVRDTARWRRDRETPPRPDFRAALYDIPRSTLYRFIGVPEHAYQLDLARVPGLWRLF